jgi:hypothetical protein
MQSKNSSAARRLIKIAVAASLVCAASASVPAAFAAPAIAAGDQAQAPSMVQAQAIQSWHEDITRMSTPAEGCFQATFPSILWKQVSCSQVQPFSHPLPRRPDALSRFALSSSASGGGTQTTGNGADYAIETSTLISSATGTFPSVTGVTSEKSVGVAAFGGGGILGANEYTLQVNSNYNKTTAACKSHSGCTVWQQFLYSPDYSTKGKAAVFIQYWLLGYGGSSCPSGFGSDGSGDCYKNSSAVTAPDVPATQLGNLKITGTATNGGNDTVVFTNGTTAYSLTAKDSVLDIATAWDQTEFNVVGNAGGSEAVFNSGSSITVKLAVADGSTATPTCASNAGSTGESNNLNLGSCSAVGGSSPYIQFTESN